MNKRIGQRLNDRMNESNDNRHNCGSPTAALPHLHCRPVVHEMIKTTTNHKGIHKSQREDPLKENSMRLLRIKTTTTTRSTKPNTQKTEHVREKIRLGKTT